MILRDEGGFSSPLAMTVIFSLCVLCGSLGMYVYSCQKKINSFKIKNEALRKAEILLADFEEDLQKLSEEDCDCQFSPVLSELKNKYSKYSVQMTDVSTGINERFLSKNILGNKNIKQLLEKDEEKIKTEYGWINKKYADETLIQEIYQDFKGKQTFLLFNEIPFFNLYNMDESFIKAILNFCNVKNVEEKSTKIYEAEFTGELTKEDLCKILEIDKNHKIFDFIGTKTVFWNVKLETEKACVNAVFAALPSENDLRKIEKYELIKRTIKYKGGSL